MLLETLNRVRLIGASIANTISVSGKPIEIMGRECDAESFHWCYTSTRTVKAASSPPPP